MGVPACVREWPFVFASAGQSVSLDVPGGGFAWEAWELWMSLEEDGGHKFRWQLWGIAHPASVSLQGASPGIVLRGAWESSWVANIATNRPCARE